MDFISHFVALVFIPKLTPICYFIRTLNPFELFNYDPLKSENVHSESCYANHPIFNVKTFTLTNYKMSHYFLNTTKYFQPYVNICSLKRPLVPLQVAYDSLKPHDRRPMWFAIPKII